MDNDDEFITPGIWCRYEISCRRDKQLDGVWNIVEVEAQVVRVISRTRLVIRPRWGGKWQRARAVNREKVR